MAVQLKYAGETYEILDTTLDQAVNDMWGLIEKTAGRGVYYVETTKGRLAILISHSIPLAFMETEDFKSAYEDRGLLTAG